jgi:hypothetical protein
VSAADLMSAIDALFDLHMSASMAGKYTQQEDAYDDAREALEKRLGAISGDAWTAAAALVRDIAADPIADLPKPLLLDIIAGHMDTRARHARGEFTSEERLAKAMAALQPQPAAEGSTP